MQRVAVEAARPQDRVHGAREAVGLVRDDAEQLLALLGCELDVAPAQRHRRAVDRGERRAQLVRDRRDELGPQLLERPLLGQVAERVHRAVGDGDTGDRQPELAPADADGQRLEAQRRGGIGRDRNALRHCVPAGDHLRDPPLEHGRTRQPGDRLRRAVPVAGDAGGVDEHHAVADRREDTRSLRALLRLAVELRVVDRHGRAAREVLGELEVGLVVGAVGLGPHEGERAERAPARDERDDDRGVDSGREHRPLEQVAGDLGP